MHGKLPSALRLGNGGGAAAAAVPPYSDHPAVLARVLRVLRWGVFRGSGPVPDELRRSDREFPTEFADVLSRKGRAILRGDSEPPGHIDESCRRVVSVDGAMDPDGAAACIAALDAYLLPVLPRDVLELAPESLAAGAGMPDCWRRKGGNLVDRESARYLAARRTGLLRMLYSESFHRFAEALSGYRLARRRLHCSIFCYEAGDYVGPHTDATSREFLALNVSLPSTAISQQWLMHQVAGGYDAMIDLASAPLLQVLRLPMWHQITPLVAAPTTGAKTPRRWLLSQGFGILGPLER